MKKTSAHTNLNFRQEGNTSSGKYMGWWLAAFAVLTLSLMLGYWYTSSVSVRNVVFEGMYFQSEESLKAALPDIENKQVDSLNYLQLIERLEAIDYIKEASVAIQPKGDLIFSVIERQPIALLTSANHRCYVDEFGVRLSIKKSRVVDVPVVYGFNTRNMQDTLKSDEFHIVKNFLLQVNHQPILSATISELALDPEDGVVALSHENGVKLIFGFSDFEKKLKYWQTFYAEIVSRQGIETFKSLDFRFEGQIVANETHKES